MTDLSAVFASQRASQIDWNGPLYSMFDLPIEVTRVSVAFQSVDSAFRQGLRLKIRGGRLEIDGVEATDLALWHDTAPNQVEVKVHWKGKGPRSLRMWNSWEHNGVAHAWLGNAGMRVDEVESGRFLLRCSDGEGEPEFDNLILGVTVE
ncbi:hypothetical protein [Janibacter indicus]|uniref:hypothetical protein n=1 Tax=Janibacter indicus TaxID=857417 RepID=UPI003EB73110